LHKLPIYEVLFFLNEEETIVIDVPKNHRPVYLLSTSHHAYKFDMKIKKKTRNHRILQFDQGWGRYNGPADVIGIPIGGLLLLSLISKIFLVRKHIFWEQIYNVQWQAKKLQRRRLLLEQLGEGLAKPHIQRASPLLPREASVSMVNRFREDKSKNCAS